MLFWCCLSVWFVSCGGCKTKNSPRSGVFCVSMCLCVYVEQEPTKDDGAGKIRIFISNKMDAVCTKRYNLREPHLNMSEQ